MAIKPCVKKLTVTQWKHSIPNQGQDAIDLSPRGFTDWRIHAPLKGTITYIQKAVKVGKKIDPYFIFTISGGYRMFFVHCEINVKIVVGFQTKQGGNIGDIAKSNPSGVPSHIHFFILDNRGKPVDVLRFFTSKGLYPNDWLKDPDKLIPKGYVMSKPVPPVVVPPVVVPIPIPTPVPDPVEPVTNDCSEELAKIEQLTIELNNRDLALKAKSLNIENLNSRLKDYERWAFIVDILNRLFPVKE